MPRGKVLVAQGGGPTAVINQSMAGVVLEARKFRNVELVYGAYHGVSGIIDEEFLDLTQETSHNIEMVANTPSSALGSTRDKPDLKYCQEIFKVLKAHGTATLHIGATILPDTVRSSAKKRAGPAMPCAVSTFRKPSTMTWSATTTRRVFHRRRALSPRPLWGPTWTTPH